MTTTLTGYHGTDARFESFSEAMLGSKEDFSANGALGVWLYLSEDLARAHGARTLRIEADAPRRLRIGISEMHRDHMRAGGDRTEAVAFFAARRAALLAEGYQAIEVEERDGTVAIAVVLDLGAIVSVEEMPRAPSP
jgi:hypothetical protein